MPGAEAPQLVAKGEAEIGVAQTSEIVPIAGAEVLGPLPGEFASTTVWTAGIGTTSIPHWTGCETGVQCQGLSTGIAILAILQERPQSWILKMYARFGRR